MREAIERARRTEYPLIALLGHPAYYPPFGFRPAEATFGITTHYQAPPEAWMALALPAYEPHIRGAFRYAPAFGD
jgi:predicted N-acetyltransferase YhbS